MLELDRLAKDDLEEIFVYLAEYDTEAAKRMIQDISSKFTLLEKNPLLGRTRHDLLINLRCFPFKSYLIFYVPVENGVEIYRILHAARNVEDVFADYVEGLDEDE